MTESPVKDYKTLALADVISSFEECAGLRCTSVGEDGDVLILGHHDEAACWAAFAALTGDDSGPDYYDLRQTQVGWANHSEGCEVVACSCADDRCDACNKGEHDACSEPDDCVCASWDHDAVCRCECYCDEYAWWVSDVRVNGEPATWVSWSYKKAAAQRAADSPSGVTS